MFENLYDTFEEYNDAILLKLMKMEEDTSISDEAFYALENQVADIFCAINYAFSDTNDIDYINSLLDELYELL